jgi:CO dehydrogenase nickel-insertion accessory protein CooC1
MVLNSGRYDLVIVDTESTINNLNRYLIEKSDQVIMVTKQSGIEYGGTVRFAEMIRNVAAGKVIYVINDYDKYSFDASGESGGFDRVDISDYIEHFRNIDALYCTDLSKCPELVKLAGKIIV